MLNLIQFIGYLGAGFGLAYIVGFATISLPLRTWLWGRPSAIVRFLVALIECPACFGFWYGLFLWVVLNPFHLGSFWPLLTCGVNFYFGRQTGLIREE
jgi:hypothetical protein